MGAAGIAPLGVERQMAGTVAQTTEAAHGLQEQFLNSQAAQTSMQQLQHDALLSGQVTTHKNAGLMSDVAQSLRTTPGLVAQTIASKMQVQSQGCSRVCNRSQTVNNRVCNQAQQIHIMVCK